VSADGVATWDPDPGARDIDAARALMARLYREYEAGDGVRCHATALEVTRYLRLVRIIVPQHPLWTVNPYRRCDFRCTYCSVHAQGAAVPVLTGEALRRRLRLELGVVPPDHHVALSSMCDAYVPAEAQLGVARLAIEELLAAGRCVHVVTKGVTVLRDAGLLRRARCGKVEVSLCTLDERIAAELEPGAPPPAERLALVDALAGAGIDVGIMIAPWIPGVTHVGEILAAAGPERRITISPLKCNAPDGRIEVAGRTHRQQIVNRRYREERDCFRGVASLRWEAPWQMSEHYSVRHLPLTFAEVDGIIQSPEPPHDRAERVLKRIGSHRIWQRVAPVHVALYRATGGRIGHRVGSMRNLLLTTRGRRSGRLRTAPLAYVEDGSRWVVVGSNGGADHDPGWLLNLRADPSATVQVRGTRITVTAYEPSRRQAMRLWTAMEIGNPLLVHYQRMTARPLPIVVLERRVDGTVGIGNKAPPEDTP
jgi:deazaflavin-dependent oxidoreductase (nitroreductase family)